MSEATSVEKVVKARPLTCVVSSASMDKSRVGVVENLVKHGRYHKYIRQTTKVMFHDQDNTTRVGDKVLVGPCRPMSARKKFKLLQVLQRAEVEE